MNMSYKVYLKQFDNDIILKMTVTGSTKIHEIKTKMRKNGYHVTELMKSDGFGILSDVSDLYSLQIFHKSVLMCLILPNDHYSLIPKKNIFHHTSTAITTNHCANGIRCKYYSFCLKYKYNKKIFNHMISTQHPNTSICRNGAKCYAYQRCIIENGYKNDDRCHILSFIHPPKINFKQNLLHKTFNPFIYCNYMMKTKLFDLIIFPNNTQQIKAKQTAEKFGEKHAYDIYVKPDYIDFLIHEMIRNGYRNELFISDEKRIDLNDINKYPSIMNIVIEKMKHSQHILYGSPLNYGEILSLILYTDSDCKYDMIQSLLFNRNVNKWRWFIFILDTAIEKLSKYEIGEIDLYSYICNYNIYTPEPLILSNTDGCMNGINELQPFICFATFIDFYVDKQLIEKQYEKNKGMGTIIKMFVNDHKDDRNRRIFSGCCDISWIEKSNETKVVFRPFATFYGYKVIEYKEKHIKMLLAHGRQINEKDKWLDDFKCNNKVNGNGFAHKRTYSTAL